MEIALPYDGDLRDVAVQQLALVSGPASSATSDPQLTGGLAVSAAPSSSPSQERLVRIAAMIRDAERAMPASDHRERRRQRGPISLRARRLRRAASAPGTPTALAS